MTMHEVVQCLLAQIEGQVAAYNADINNTLTLLNTLQQQAQVLITWLANNPA